MNILHSSAAGMENKSAEHPDRVDNGIRRRSAIVNGSALAAAALMARANVALAQQTDQTAGSQATSKPNPSVRRVVTGTDSRGRSHVLMDGNPTHVFGGFLTQVWVTDRVPTSNTGTNDNADRPQRLEPPPGGTQLVFFVLAPQSASASVAPAEMEKNVAGMFEALGGSHARVDMSRNVGMHKTKTVDYVILLSGEVDLLLDDGEVHLKPSDIVIQRGTNHAWVNTGTETALLAGVLIDAEPLGT
jgi:mannose-6-phosphate isomerase-like protein (cupin superfamily)